MKLVKLGGLPFWADDNFNYWSAREFTESQAFDLAKTLKGCSYCINCNNLTNSFNCNSCAMCSNIANSSFCYHCKNSQFLFNCKGCVNCSNLSNQRDLSNSSNTNKESL